MHTWKKASVIGIFHTKEGGPFQLLIMFCQQNMKQTGYCKISIVSIALKSFGMVR